MNGLMNIQIRVMSASAQKRIRELEAELAMLRKQVNSTSAAMNNMGSGGVRGMTRWGNQVQWAGRQLQYNFTLPILLAGAAAAKFALDNEKAMVRVTKVYGDGSAAMNKISQKEIPALKDAFEALSSTFGVAQDDAINIAADWAAAGASGLALAKSVKLTMETMILGEIEATEATQALIAIQAQYGFGVEKLSRTIDVLNMTENQTGITMAGLIDGFSRAAGVARSAGIDVEHLAAMMAALTPAAGSASNAGQALKTIISRLLSPTGEAAAVMKEMGINTRDLAWQSLNGAQRLEEMAKSFDKLDDGQKAAVSSSIASRWQINRFDVLMRDMINTNGYYQKSLDATASAQDNFAQRQRELNAVLESNPQKLKQIWVILQNAMAKVIQPMIPVILLLAAQVAKLMQAFQGLSPEVQKFVLFALLALAAVGPLARYIGSVSVLLGMMHAVLVVVSGALMSFGSALVWLAKGPIKLAQGAIAGLVAAFSWLAGGIATALAPVTAAIAGALSTAFAVAMGTARFAVVTLGRVVMTTAAATASGVMAVMAAWWTAILGLPYGIIATISSYVYTFLVVAIPSILARAYAPIFTASVLMWSAMQRALMLSASGLLAAAQFAFGTLIGFIARQALGIYAAATTAFTALSTSLVVAMARMQRMLMMLPAMMMWAMTMTGAALAAGMRALVTLMTIGMANLRFAFALGMSALPAIASATWAAILNGAKVLRYLGPILISAIMSPWTYVVLAVIALLVAFRDKIGKAWNTIVETASKAFWALPESVRDAMLAVVRVVRIAVLKVYEWFSYLNPFARHSPSLVDQVTEGMAEIKRQYASVSNVGGVFAKAARDLKAFKDAIAGISGGEWGEERAGVAASIPKALPLFDALIGDLKSLNTILAQQGTAVDAQQRTVDRWSAALELANVKLDQEEAALNKVQDRLDSLTTAYDAHKDAMEAYASAPLVGMGAMEDQIFANEMAQNSLRLEMLRWEEANGPIADVESSMAALAGSMEMLRGEANSLREAGAGSDVLGPIQNELAAMQATYDAMGDAVSDSPVNEMQKQLEELERQAEIMDLEKSLAFDGAIREIDKLVNAQAELSYDEIVAGINSQKAAMAVLEPQIASATAAVLAQQAAVDSAKSSRDALQAVYDVEKAKLDALTDSYEQTADMIRQVESALNDMGAAASDAAAKAAAARSGLGSGGEYVPPAVQNFRDAEGANFPDVGGMEKIGREGGAGDQSKMIEEFTKGLTDDLTAEFEKFDMFGPIKRKWNEFTGWLQENVWSNMGGVEEAFRSSFLRIGDFLYNTGISKFLGSIWESIKTGVSYLPELADQMAALFGDDFAKIWKEISKIGQKLRDELGPELAKFKDLLPKLKTIFGALWTVIKVVAGVIGVLLVGAFKIVTSILAHVLGPAIDMIIGVFKALVKIVRGVMEFLTGLFTGDFQRMADGITSIVSGLFDGIWSIIKGAWNIIWGAVEGLINGVIDWFKWLYDELVGHSIIPDMIKAIVEWFKKLPGWVWDAIKNLAVYIKDVVVEAWNNFKNASVEKWNDIANWLKGRAQAAYDKLISIKDKLQTAAKESWEAFKNKSSELWNAFITYLKARPQQAYDNLIAIKDKLVAIAKAAFEAFQTKAKEIIDGKNGMMTWISGIPGRIGGLLGKVGSIVADSVKASWNSAAKWINDNGIAAVNKVTTKFGFTLGDLPRFAGGGVIPGRVSKRDNTIIAARTGEGVIVPELVRHMGGARGLAYANKAAKTGNINALRSMGLDHYENGGIIGKVAGWLKSGAGSALGNIIGAMKQPVRSAIPGQPFAEDWAVGALQGWQNAAKAWGDKKEEAASAATGAMGGAIGGMGSATGGMGVPWMKSVLRSQFPFIQFYSGYRPGAITASGAQSWHGKNRALDMSPRMDVFNWIRSKYGKNSKELYYSPAGWNQILYGKPHYPTGVTRAMHFNHVHWAYDKGGILPPGLTMAQNNTGQNEYTITAAQFRSLSNVSALLERMTQKSTGGTPGAAAVTRLGTTLGTVEARLRSAETRSLQPTRSSGGSEGNTYNFYGDLEFPNVKDGSSAEDFLKNLKGLGG